MYLVICTLCEEDFKQSVYIGDSSRSLNLNSNQHLFDFSRPSMTDSGDSVSSFYMDYFKEYHLDQVKAVNPNIGIRWNVLDPHRASLSGQKLRLRTYCKL